MTALPYSLEQADPQTPDEKVEEVILAALGERTQPIQIETLLKDLGKSIPDVDEIQAKQLVWRLIDDHRVDLTADMRLRLHEIPQ